MAYGYKGRALELINKYGIKVGDRILAKTNKESFTGILMPRSELDDDVHLVLKLDDGYNIGLSTDSLYIEKLQQEEVVTPPPMVPISRSGLPRVSIISTGGTIASRVDYRTGAVSPALSAQDLYESVPELGELADIRTEILFSLLSENIVPENWTVMAHTIQRHIKEGAFGIVVTHGTDTLGYTAAALSFALRNLPVPVILVGSQRSSDRPSSDAYLNLKGAVLAAARAPFAEVGVLMHASSSDRELVIHRGTKVRKMHTSRRDAFSSINSTPLAKLIEGKVEVCSKYKERGGDLELKPDFDEDVVLIKSFPGIPTDIFDPIIHRGFHGIVLEGTGLGHVPERIFPSIKRAIQSGIVVVMASQCLYGRVNMNVYSTGRNLLSMGVIPAGDMLPETALVKLMWVLAQTRDYEEVRKLFMTNIAGELSKRSEYTEE
ncbi:MAG: Glu-tRNA(Gln) amidotransferase subunit GatD [Candidatus Methanomethylicaceae archaeon]